MKTFSNMWPVMKDDIEFTRSIMPTIREITDAVVSNKNITKLELLEWSDKIITPGSDHIKKWMKALKDSPLQNLKEESKKLDLTKMQSILSEEQYTVLEEGVIFIQSVFEVMAEMQQREEQTGVINWVSNAMEVFTTKIGQAWNSGVDMVNEFNEIQ